MVIRHSLALLILIIFQPVQAGEIQRAEIHYQDGVYIMQFDVIIHAQFENVLAIVTDYQNMDRLSESFIESALIHSSDETKKRRRLVMRICVLFFCTKITFVEDMQEIHKGIIIATIIPEQSDFKSGRAEWRVTSVGNNQSRIQLYFEEEPGFWIPPVIGPLIVKNTLLKLAKENITQIEILAKDA